MKLDLEANVSETTRLLKDGGAGVLEAGADPSKILGVLAGPYQTVTTYEAEDLTHWSAVLIYSGTIFTQRHAVRIFFLQTLTCWGVAYVLYYTASHPENYRTDAVQDLIQMMSISIAFLIGLFLNQCVSRWWETVKAIEGLSGSMRKLAMSANDLRLPAASIAVMTRCAVLSIRMLDAEITFAKHEHRQKGSSIAAALPAPGSGEPRSIDLATFWGTQHAEMVAKGFATQSDIAVLAEIPPDQKSAFCWSIVCSELRNIRAGITLPDGKPDAKSYDRMCGIAQECSICVSGIKTLAAYQLPFIYVHMLAFMVHMVNIMTAVGTGVSIGLLLAKSHVTKMPLDMGQVGSYMVFVLVQAFIYQAFLSIGAALSFPITGSAYNIQLAEKADALEKQLKLMDKLSLQVNTGLALDAPGK